MHFTQPSQQVMTLVDKVWDSPQKKAQGEKTGGNIEIIESKEVRRCVSDRENDKEEHKDGDELEGNLKNGVFESFHIPQRVPA